jgi:hypothetical protein
MKKLIIALASTAMLTACGGGGGGGTVVVGTPSGPAVVELTHEQVANEFIRRVNSELGDLYMLDLVKANTLQYDYIVVYDHDYSAYDAYYIGDWAPGMDLLDYLWGFEDMFYYDLIPVGGNTYQDPITGILFEKQAATGKNLGKLKAAKEAISVKKQSEKLVAKYGLSTEKATEAARFAYKLKTSAAGTYKVSDYDAFAKEFVGSSISEFQADWKDGNAVSLAGRIQKASDMTGMGMEGMNKLIGEMFLNP